MAKNSRLLVDLGQGFTLAVGLPTIATWNTDSRPKNAKRGTFGFNAETNSLEYWSGVNWFRAQLEDA